MIEEGSGYWRYIPVENGVRFFTWYDYRARFGKAGGLFDRTVFKPLIGWATAWSFDRLRLWIEQDIHPRLSMRFAIIHALARLTIAFTWIWQGVMPKLLFPSPTERVLMVSSGISPGLLPWLGAVEVCLGLAALLPWRGFFMANAGLMVLALLSVALTAPRYIVEAFNPVTLDIGLIALSGIGFLASGSAPSARLCLRRAPEV